MRHEIDRNQDAEYSWLERQLYSAYKNNQVIIVNRHRPNADAGNLKKFYLSAKNILRCRKSFLYIMRYI